MNKILFGAESLIFVPLTQLQNTLLSVQFGFRGLGTEAWKDITQ